MLCFANNVCIHYITGQSQFFSSKYLTQLTDKMHKLINKLDMMIT